MKLSCGCLWSYRLDDTFWATGITAHLKNGGKLEVAQQIAAHESSRTTGLYDRRDDDVNLNEVERISM
jgi:integrase/recombinase XerD